MLQYNEDLNLLVLHKVLNPDMTERFDVLKDIRDAYKRFLDVTCYEALEALNDKLKESYKERSELEFFGKMVDGYGSDEKHLRIYTRVKDMRYPEIPVIDLPYMDDLGKLHFYDRKVKTLINRVTSSDDISYDSEKKMLTLVLNKKTVKLDCSSAKHNIRMTGRASRKISVPNLITLMAHVEGRDKDVSGVITNPILQESLSKSHRAIPGQNIPYTSLLDTDAEISSGTGLVLSLTGGGEYSAEKIRDSLNAAASIDRALGETLSRPVLGYDSGTYITPAILESCHKSKLNIIHIKTVVPNPSMKISGDINGKPLIYTQLFAGTRVTDYMLKALPQYEGYTVLPDTVTVEGSHWYMAGKPATKEILDFIYSTGKKGVTLGDKQIPWHFETEIIGNNTAKYGSMYSAAECHSMGIKPHEWCYFSEEANNRKDYITSDDLLALYSTIGYMLLTGKNIFADRDRDFLKKVDLADVTMARALKIAVIKHLLSFGPSVLKYIKDGDAAKGGVPIFAGLNKSFKSQLMEDGLIDTPDRTNLIAEISQASHLTTVVTEAPAIVRQIAIAYNGRVCPFETPEGQKIGLVNTKAMGCKIRDGYLYATVRAVIKTSEGISISPVIEELSVKASESYRIGDILTLTPKGDGEYYEDTRVSAQVPNPDPNSNRLIYADIMASDLDYVFAHTEGHISVATSMIPYACANDAVRDSFGSKMIKSAILLLNPDEPCVTTSTYRNLFNNSSPYLVRAERNGYVVEIGTNMLTVMYDGDNDETNYALEECKVTTDSVLFLRYKVRTGERFSKGTILVDSSATKDGVYCSGKDALVLYASTGFNYEDALDSCEKFCLDMMSVGSTSITKKKIKGATVDTTGMYKYYKRGDIVTNIQQRTSRGEKYEVTVAAEHASGIWYNTSEVTDGRGLQFKLDFLGYNMSQKGDKWSGRHGNKGVLARRSQNSYMPQLANGRQLEVIMNPHGIPSRMNDGQVEEAHTGLIAKVLGINTNADSYNCCSLAELRMLMRFTFELANADKASDFDKIVSKYPDIPKNMYNKIRENMPEIMTWAGCFDEYGDARIWDPVNGKWYPFPMTIGVASVMKMKQEAETKIHIRAGMLEETYRLTTSQPVSGGSAGGGQKAGEMEQGAIAAYGAAMLLYEMNNLRSDNETARNNAELQAINSPLRVPEKWSQPRTFTNFIYALEGCGIQLVCDNDELPDVSLKESEKRYVYDIKKLVKDKMYTGVYATATEEVSKEQQAVDTLLHNIFG